MVSRMDDKPRIARATALLAANAYALISAMDIIENDGSLPPDAVFVLVIPAIGLGLSYAVLEQEKRSVWSEVWAAAPVAFMLLIWMAYQRM